jgi:hypothetical protein
MELSKQKTLALPINTLCPLILRGYQANEGWNWAELDARTQVARIEWAVSGLTSNTFATHCWMVRARCGASPGAEESRYRLAAGAMSRPQSVLLARLQRQCRLMHQRRGAFPPEQAPRSPRRSAEWRH